MSFIDDYVFPISFLKLSKKLQFSFNFSVLVYTIWIKTILNIMLCSEWN